MQSNNELIQVKQLPIIVEQLQMIKEEVTTKVENAMALVCTEDNYKDIKKVRTALNNEFKELETKRKEVKKAVMLPYEQFEEVYKECVSDIFRKGDAELKSKINAVEDELKNRKVNKLSEFFNEYVAEKESTSGLNLDFLSLDRANIGITVTASMKSMQDNLAAFIDNTISDMLMIETQENKEEILVEYKNCLSVSKAVMMVNERKRAIEAERAKAMEQTVQKLNEDIVVPEQPIEVPPEELASPTVVEEDPIMTTKPITARKSKLIKLKKFMDGEGGYQYE